MEMLLSNSGVGYDSDEEFRCEMVPDDDDLIEAALYDSGFPGIAPSLNWNVVLTVGQG
jgi:hypothetical protein